jgi:hypothetical protein
MAHVPEKMAKFADEFLKKLRDFRVVLGSDLEH